MSSPETHGAAASAPEPLPAPLEAAAALAYRANELGEKGRSQRAREKHEAALTAARPHCEPDSLILVQLLMAAHTCGQQEAKHRSDADGLDYCGVGQLEEAVDILHRRHAAGTLVPSTPLEHRFRERSALPLAVLDVGDFLGVRRAGAPAPVAPSAQPCHRPFGGGYDDYITACTFLFKRLIRASIGSFDPTTLALLLPPAEVQLPYATRLLYERFTLAGLDLMAEVHAEVHAERWSHAELTLVRGVQGSLEHATFAPGAWATAVARKFGEGRFAARSGVTGGGLGALCTQLTAVGSARVRALDVAQHGLQRCGLPSCTHAPETFPREFKRCGACNHAGAAYCCKEHQVAHWKGGHKQACSRLAAARAGA